MEELQKLTIQVRRDILRMVHKVNSGHPGGSLGCTEFLVVLYKILMDRKLTFEMNGFNEDLFFLSNGHISPSISTINIKILLSKKVLNMYLLLIQAAS